MINFPTNFANFNLTVEYVTIVYERLLNIFLTNSWKIHFSYISSLLVSWP